MSYSIRVQELKDRLDKGDKIFLLDVRESWEYSMAKIDGSVLISLDELPQFLKSEKGDRFICREHHATVSPNLNGS